MRVKRIKSLFCLGLILVSLLSIFAFKSWQKYDEVIAQSNEFNRINASGVVVMEGKSGRVLFSQNENTKLPMASTTKILTCITVIENCKDLNEYVTVPEIAQGVEGSSIYLRAGEKQKVIDLLYGLMLQSGNDCAVTLAYCVSGGIENFANLMNLTAKRAGAENSNFINPHGLPNDNHYTTALDLAKISAYAMKNPIFRQIVGTKKHVMPYPGKDYDRIILNKNKMLSTIEGGCGIKTGYTKKAGRCLVSCVNRNGMDVICVVLNCPMMFEDSRVLIEEACSRYKMYELVKKESVFGAKVLNGKEDLVYLAPQQSFEYPLTEKEFNDIEVSVSEVVDLTAPVKKQSKNGKINVYMQKQLIFSSELYTIYNVESKTF